MVKAHVRKVSLFALHDGYFVACGVGEVEPATAGEAEDGEGDLAAGFQDALLGFFEILRFDDRQWGFGAFGGVRVEAALSAAVGESGIGWAVVLECPAEEVGVEIPGRSQLLSW
jgi:hypothetical protein